MSHRIALERSKIIAGFGCHGGTLIQQDADLAAQKKRFDLQPMPAYTTGGGDDGWFDVSSFTAWTTYNGCAANATSAVTIPAKAEGGKSGSLETTLTVASSCGAASSPAVEVARLVIANFGHVPDERMAKMTWDFLKKYKRAGALAALPADPNATATPALADAPGPSPAPADAASAAVAYHAALVAAVAATALLF